MNSLTLIFIFVFLTTSLLLADQFVTAGPVQLAKRTRSKLWPCLVAAGSVTGFTLSKCRERHMPMQQMKEAASFKSLSGIVGKKSNSDSKENEKDTTGYRSFQDLYSDDSFLDFNHKVMNEHWKSPSWKKPAHVQQSQYSSPVVEDVDEDNYFTDNVSIDDYFDYHHPNGVSILMKKTQPNPASYKSENQE